MENYEPHEKDANIHTYERIMEYLLKKNLHIDIWDADSQMLYGVAEFPLKIVLRNQER